MLQNGTGVGGSKGKDFKKDLPTPSNSFYGKGPRKKTIYDVDPGLKQRQERVAKREKMYDSVPSSILEKYYHTDIDSIFLKWCVFPTQAKAFLHADKCFAKVHVFSTEYGNNHEGKRRYIVSTYDDFWLKLNKLHPNERTFYELIREGCPCKLYFDLEFKIALNENADGNEMVKVLVDFVCKELMNVFKVSCNRNNVLELDSTTQKKFSRHLVFNIPNIAFADNAVVGSFVHYVLNQLEEQGEQDHKLKSLFVQEEEGRVSSFVDPCVYSKNRNFRTYKSKKAGKDTFLEIAKQNSFVPFKKTANREKDMFLYSMIGNIQFNDQTRVLNWKNDNCKPTCSTGAKDPRVITYSVSNQTNYSPFPDCDRFIKTLVSRGGVEGFIRRCAYFPESKLITYDIGRNRWCEYIGRAHKGNHIYFVIDLRNMTYAQKCHDPECKQKYPPINRVLPKGVLDPLGDLENEYDDGELSDSDLISLLESEEKKILNATREESDYFDDISDSEFLEVALPETR
eukprot:Nk52_evm9s232 gene=Nk52_evmTU9s232